MTSGGARPRSGPPRDPNAIRRGRESVDRSGFVHLPAAGRDGETPAWPLGRPTKFELEQWEQLWRRPQAIMWERLSIDVQVAMYVRTLRDASKSGAAATRMTALLRQTDSLGLSVAGLAANRWVIEEAPAEPVTSRRPASSSARDRLTALQGGRDTRAS
jgi:hypothetical protein